jgi:hypothetical protein
VTKEVIVKKKSKIPRMRKLYYMDDLIEELKKHGNNSSGELKSENSANLIDNQD